MDLRSRIEKYRQEVRNFNYLKTAVLGGVLALSGKSVSAQTQNLANQEPQVVKTEQNIAQGAGGKHFSLFGGLILNQSDDFGKVFEKNQIPHNGADYESVFFIDNGLIVGEQFNEQDECQYTIWAKDEQGKMSDVTDKYLLPGYSYFCNYEVSAFTAYTDDGDDADHYLIFHKDKTAAKFSAEALPENFVTTPKCILVKESYKDYTMDDINSNLYYFMPNVVKEKMIFEDGRQVELPQAFRGSEVDKNGDLITYPVSKQGVRDFVENGLFNGKAEQVIENNLERFVVQLASSGEAKVEFFFDVFNTPKEQQGIDWLEESFGVTVHEIYNMENLRKFFEDHKKIVKPSRNLVLTPNQFKNAGR